MFRSREEILYDIKRLVTLHREGKLGGEHMPEDALYINILKID
ncbi:hypothetical protein [Paenibacillus sp.]|nr:hypothetical protein [Paenibacillus sp.]